MMRRLSLLAAIVLMAGLPVFAEYCFTDKGTWPTTWPQELESLRPNAITYEGPLLPLQHYAIPFASRDAFEAAWPHLLQVKSAGAPIVLRRGPSFWLRENSPAGVCIHTPPDGQEPLTDNSKIGGNWEKTIYIELIVDGEIVDLNRIQLPANTPIIDERFEAGK